MSTITTWWAALQWHQAQWLWWLPVLAILLGGLHHYGLLRLRALARVPFNLGRVVLRHSRPEALAALRGRRRSAHRLPGLGRGLAVSLLGLLALASLAGPYVNGKRLPEPIPYREVVFILDTSISMSLRDYRVAGQRVDRMTMVKNVMHYFIDQLRGNRIGLLAFSESAYAVVPLTNDYRMLGRQLDRLQPALFTGRTSDVGYGLMYTVNYLRQQGLDQAGRKPALVLLSDVKSPSREVSPVAVAQFIHQQGYTLHTIAIGAGDSRGGEKNEVGLIYQPANFPLLADIAHAGGGQAFVANSSESLKQAVLQVQAVEQRKVEQPPRYVPINLYQWPLALFLGLLLGLQLWKVLRP